MSISIEKKKGFQILRLTSGDISESETSRIIDSVRSALSEGTRCQAISLEAPLCSNIMMMGLLVMCEKMVRHFEGHLGFIIGPGCNESGLRSLCDSLNIALYDDDNEFILSSAAIAARHQEEAPFSGPPKTDFIMQRV